DYLASVFNHLEGNTLIASPASAAVDAEQVDSVETLVFEHPRYRQAFDGFEAGMMALDVLFSYGPQARTIVRDSIRAFF
ncbi:MAG TPA: WbqC family protein, partial [Rhodothermales bacterium]|nr:WbqC family protein [Rhodothermales bacterium]